MRVVKSRMRWLLSARVVCAVLACVVSGVGATFVTAWMADHGQPLYFPTTGVLEGYSGDWPHPMVRRNLGLPGLGGDGGVNGETRPTHVSRAHEWNRDRLLYTRADPRADVMQMVTGMDEGMDCVLTGVPFRALTRWGRPDEGGPFPEERKVPTGAFRVGRIWRGWGNWTLPVHPVWPGFAYNAAIYTVLAWLIGWMVWRVPRGIRGRVRRGKGMCEGCGYDLKGLTSGGACPECGIGRVS